MLPPAARAVIAHVAVMAHPSAELLMTAVGTDTAAHGLRAAREAGILTAGGPLRFTHPLLATAAWEVLTADEQRVVHRQLATAVDEPEERARHMAHGSEGPDQAIAEELDRAAVHAHARGAPDIAGELAELAATVTPSGDPLRATRMAGASRCWVMGGDIVRARGVVERALDAPESAGGSGRAALLHALAGITQLQGDFITAAQLGNQALAEVGTDEALGIDIRLTLAGSSFITGRDWEAGARHAADALAIAERAGDERLLARTIGKAASWRYATGGGIDPQLERRTGELEPWVRHLRTLDMPAFDLASMLVMDGQTTRGYGLVRELVERAERDGDASSLPFLLANLATADFLAGDAAAARARLDRADRMAEVTEQATARVHVLVARVRLEARLGAAEVAIAAAREALRLMDATGWRVAEWRMRSELALLELSRDDPTAALAWVAGATDPTVDERAGDGSGRRFGALATVAESLVALGRLDEGAVALDGLDARLRTHASPRDRGEALRARARLAAARGEVDEAGAAIAEAEAIHRGMEDGWEVARTLVVAAEIHRRGRRRAKARDALREALSLFAGLGARRWAKVVQDGMGRTGTAHDGGPLTPTQRRVAELAAGGMTNRQIADRLSMSRHTAEAHLSAAYRALEIEGRAELAAALSEVGDRDSAAQPRDSATS
jgi:DNA-binding CsgD family transcriptional regulator